jgi:TM2 domain-containing membrane protein YozV
MGAAPAPKGKSTALVLELLPGILFGLMGIGWMYAGKSDKGIWWLVGSIAWWVIMGVVGLLTIGIGCLCFPLIWVAAGISAYQLNNQMKAEPGRYQ